MKRTPIKLASCFALTLMLIVLLPARAFAWGAAGHRIVAMIAEGHLNAKTRAAIDLLLDDQTLSDIANYADAIRNKRPETANFHFVDVPLGKDVFDPAKDCPQSEKGDCVIAALNRFAKEANNPALSIGKRRFALKFIVHLVGDMHQPLHCADNNDRGGNDVNVSWFGRKGKGVNLHSVWDRLIIEAAELEDAEFAQALEDEFTEQQTKDFQKKTLVDWANEAHRLAQKFAYGKLPDDRALGQQYYDATFAVVDEQLYKGGVRLAQVLNTIYK
jgi:hypothetical protein